MHIKQGDEVQILAGNDKGKRGKVMKVIDKTDRVLVEGVNIRVKHLQKTQANPEGGKVEKEFPIAASNVLIWSEKAGKGVRTKSVIEGDKKIRVGVPCGTKFD
ncbi:MAG: 50S ribosomal protein L24 [Planctomycetes bacterium]|nr:50S ribosomal protein L24 [Planctomycetota bacterium]MCP4770297.1 50S ribosomal protein L24 [Planctomycetota bacterium]MCP4861471.1 50S ribosomal protein L24 [Planctomycetota bacterium]